MSRWGRWIDNCANNSDWNYALFRGAAEITMVYVTHDQEEAFTMSTKVGIMNRGSMLQLGTPEQISIAGRPISSLPALLAN